MAPEDHPQRLSGLSFQDASGKKMSLADFAGKTLLVNVWATWCVPCRAEMPALDKLEAKLGGKDFQVVAVNIDTGDPNKPAKFLKEIGVTHVKLHRDPTMGVFNELKGQGLAFGLPVSLLVNGKGCLLGAMNGPAEWDGADAAKLIKAAIGLQTKAAGEKAASL
jgi:thiol-disulfide isomerase/thioredoxin